MATIGPRAQAVIARSEAAASARRGGHRRPERPAFLRRPPGADATTRPRGVDAAGGSVRGAFTLMEALVALTLIVMLLSAMLMFFWQTIEIRDAAQLNADRTQLARQVLARIEGELRGCLGSDQLGFPVEQRLIGDRRRISFLTTALPGDHQYVFYRESDTPPPAQHDLTLISYQLWVDPQNTDENGDPVIGGIIRTEKKTLNQFLVDEDDPLDVRNDLWSPELAYLEFRYFDGIEWDIKWDLSEGNSLPQAILVTVGFDKCTRDDLENRDLESYPIADYPFGPDLEHPDRYSTLVRMPAADRFFGSRVQRLGKQVAEQLGVEGVP